MTPTRPDWPALYIGHAWIAGEHDCWHFARRVWREVFGLNVPVVEVDAINRMATSRAFSGHAEVSAWQRMDTPEEGAGVLLGKSARPAHVGVWTTQDGGGLVHCVEGAGVVFQRPADLAASGWRVLGYYQRRADPCRESSGGNA